MHTVADVADYLGRIAPLALAETWDNVGLLLGDRAAPVEKAMTCLTVTPETAAEAIEAKAQLIVSHHPILFRPVQKWTTASADGRLLLALVRAGCAVYSPHTAFDNAPDGINDILARRLGLTAVAPLRPAESAPQCKVVAFVPDADVARVSSAMFEAGAGRIGQYRECSFRLAGTGTFFGSETTNPTVGENGRREDVPEWRLEVLCPDSLVEPVVSALRRAHSYEEPAYDVYPLRSLPVHAGAGRIGLLPAPLPLSALADLVQRALYAGLVQTVGQGQKIVQRVAIACGAGGEFLKDSLRQKADVLLTGEMRFHDCLAAEAANIGVILSGHYASERCGVEELAGSLRREFPHLHVWASNLERDPLQRA